MKWQKQQQHYELGSLKSFELSKFQMTSFEKLQLKDNYLFSQKQGESPKIQEQPSNIKLSIDFQTPQLSQRQQDVSISLFKMKIISLQEQLQQKEEQIEQIQSNISSKEFNMQTLQKKIDYQQEMLQKYENMFETERAKNQETLENFQETQVKLQLFQSLSSSQLKSEQQLQRAMNQLEKAQEIIKQMENQIKQQQDSVNEKDIQLQDKQELLVDLQLQLEMLKNDTLKIDRETNEGEPPSTQLNLYLQKQNQDYEELIKRLKEEVEEIKLEKDQIYSEFQWYQEEAQINFQKYVENHKQHIQKLTNQYTIQIQNLQEKLNYQQSDSNFDNLNKSQSSFRITTQGEHTKIMSADLSSVQESPKQKKNLIYDQQEQKAEFLISQKQNPQESGETKLQSEDYTHQVFNNIEC